MTKGFKLTEEEAVQFMLENGIRPLESFKSALSLWECECLTCGENIITKYSRIQQGGGCAFCAGKKINLVEANLIMAKANLEPLEEFKTSKSKWKCRCLVCKRIVYPAYGNIKSGQNGCSFCTGQSVDVQEALQKMKLANLSPLTEYTKGKDKWKANCLICQRIIFPTYNQIQQGSGGCKYCSKRYIEKSEAAQFMLERRLKPLEEYSKASAKWLCECLDCGSKISVKYSNVRRGIYLGCTFCAGVRIKPEDAIKLMLSVNLKPLKEFESGSAKWKCECLKCGKIFYRKYNHIKSGYGPCGYCAGKVVDTVDAIVLMQSAGLEPLEPYSKALERWKCKCEKCGRLVYPTYSAIKKGQGGCRFCAQIGIDYTGPGFLYLMTHHQLGAHKIGIGGSKRTRSRDRVTEHQKFGWELFRRLDFESADGAFQVEQSALEWLRGEMKLATYLSVFEMPQGGYSETVDASEIDLPTIWAKVEELSRVKR